MIENQLMSTGAFEITLNGKSVPLWPNGRVMSKELLLLFKWRFCLCNVIVTFCGDAANFRVSFFYRCASVVQTRVGSPAIHATARANPGQRDEDERSHEHKTSPLLTLLFTCWFKAPPCE